MNNINIHFDLHITKTGWGAVKFLFSTKTGKIIDYKVFNKKTLYQRNFMSVMLAITLRSIS